MAKDQDTDHARAGRELRDLVLSCRWFEVCRAGSLAECWRKLLDWSPPAGVQFDERKVERIRNG